MTCPDLDLDLDRAGDPDVALHLERCAPCRREADARRQLRDRLRALDLPAPPGLRERIRRAIDAEPARVRPWRVALGTAAAALLVAALFLASPSASLPEIVVSSSDFHDKILAGRVPIEDPAALRAMGLEVVTPKLDADLVGCPCDERERHGAAPWVLYRVRGEALSLFVIESNPPVLPRGALRLHQGREYYLFRCNRNTILVCQSGALCHLWISRMDEDRMLATVLATPTGQSAFSGEHLTLKGVT